MRSKVLFTFAILIAIVLALVSAIHADVSHDPHNPIPIPCDQSIDFTLTGNRAGAFAYYSIDYPGDGRIITIELDMAPGDPVVMQAAGFNVYGPNAYYIGSKLYPLSFNELTVEAKIPEIFNFFLSLYLFISTLFAEIFSIDAISFDEKFSLINAESLFSLSVKPECK